MSSSPSRLSRVLQIPAAILLLTAMLALGSATPAGAFTAWAGQTSGTTNALMGVDCVDALTCVAVGENATILRTTNGGTTWSPENHNLPAVTAPAVQPTLFGVSCPDTTTCYAVGRNATILKRIVTGGVATWTKQMPATWLNQPDQLAVHQIVALHDVDCPTTDICFAVGSPKADPVQGGDPGQSTIIATVNGGGVIPVIPGEKAGWVDQVAPSYQYLYDVSCLNAVICVAAGYMGQVVMTETGGVPWTLANTGVASGSADGVVAGNEIADVRGVTCTSVLICLAVDASGRIMRSLSGGSTWTTVLSTLTTPSSTSPLESVSCAPEPLPGTPATATTPPATPAVDTTNCFSVGYAGKIFSSTNGGQTWSADTSGITTDLHRVSCVGGPTGTCRAVGASGKILRN